MKHRLLHLYQLNSCKISLQFEMVDFTKGTEVNYMKLLQNTYNSNNMLCTNKETYFETNSYGKSVYLLKKSIIIFVT